MVRSASYQMGEITPTAEAKKVDPPPEPSPDPQGNPGSDGPTQDEQACVEVFTVPVGQNQSQVT